MWGSVFGELKSSDQRLYIEGWMIFFFFFFFLQGAVSQSGWGQWLWESICFIYLKVYVNFPGILLKSIY